ncbi:MAG: hypothetical protein DMG57_05250 [Acidobacteria bacterium]|nr:MAG: hypothetical protein DMG57_05250 [Acidobacteriota bacterium]
MCGENQAGRHDRAKLAYEGTKKSRELPGNVVPITNGLDARLRSLSLRPLRGSEQASFCTTGMQDTQ